MAVKAWVEIKIKPDCVQEFHDLFLSSLALEALIRPLLLMAGTVLMYFKRLMMKHTFVNISLLNHRKSTKHV